MIRPYQHEKFQGQQRKIRLQQKSNSRHKHEDRKLTRPSACSRSRLEDGGAGVTGRDLLCGRKYDDGCTKPWPRTAAAAEPGFVTSCLTASAEAWSASVIGGTESGFDHRTDMELRRELKEEALWRSGMVWGETSGDEWLAGSNLSIASNDHGRYSSSSREISTDSKCHYL